MSLKRTLSYDLVCVVAIAMVVMIHVTSYLVTIYEGTDSATFAVANFFNALGRAGTPMFMMLTGALLLDEEREEHTRELYRKTC